MNSVALIGTDKIGQPSGVAGLDAGGKVPAGQLPAMNYVPTTRKVNNKALSADITLTAADVGARPSTWTPTATEVGAAVPSTQVSATLTTAWSGAGPFTQAVTIAGMTATKNGIIGLAPTATAAERAAAKAASLMLTSQGTDTITITADGDKPTIALPIVVTMMG